MTGSNFAKIHSMAYKEYFADMTLDQCNLVELTIKSSQVNPWKG